MLNEKQQIAMSMLQSGTNVFISGEAGTGKSFVLNRFLENQSSKNIVKTAPTGISALQIKGVTLHRAFNLKPDIYVNKDIPYKLPDVILSADIIIIDEISMVRSDLFDYVTKIIQAVEARRHKKIQLIVVGDFAQLPPVITEKEQQFFDNDGFAFQGEMWAKMDFECILLTEVVRQQDKAFATHLNAIRRGQKDALSWFNEESAEEKISTAITLTPYNKKADEINNKALEALKNNKRITYIAEEIGTVTDSDRITLPKLTLVEQCRVVLLINDKENRFRNGTLGTIIDLNDNRVVIRLDDGKIVEIPKYKWTIYDYKIEQKEDGTKQIKQVEIGSYEQIPVKIAYAITIHRSQGQTYDVVNVDPTCFAEGQLYVALSRATDIKRMHLLSDLQDEYLKTSQEVIDFYATFENPKYENVTAKKEKDIESVTKPKINRGRGGKREGSGRKKIMGDTKVIRLPVDVANLLSKVKDPAQMEKVKDFLIGL